MLDSHATWANMEEKMAPVKNPVGPHAPNNDKTKALLSPMGYVLPINAIAFGTKRAGPIP
jgi:hypothetical protein